MPRIRSLKPEAPQHRKVGRLSIPARWLWVTMITQADDEGRLIADPGQLRLAAFGYDLDVTDAKVAELLEEITSTGLIRRYAVRGVPHAYFPSWRDHQRIDRPKPSKLNPPPGLRSTKSRPRIGDASTTHRAGSRIKDQGSDQGRDQGSPPPPSPASTEAGVSCGDGGQDRSDPNAWSQAPWPSPEALAAMWNHLTPDNVTVVETLSPSRVKRALRLLELFPEKNWWETVFAEYRRSKFLRGRAKPSAAYPHFRPEFDWLLSSGRDGTENVVKVHDGLYADE